MSEEKLDNLIKNVAKIETLFASAMSKVNERDETIKNKDARITELTDKYIDVTKDREVILKSKMELMDTITKERESFHIQIRDAQKAINEQKTQIQTLKESRKLAQDSVMGSSFTIDQYKKMVEERDQKISEFESRMATIASGSTGIFFELPNLIEYLKKRIAAANRSLKIVLPTIDFMNEYGLIALIDNLPSSCGVNIATAFDMVKNADIIEKWKKKGFYLTEFNDKNLIALSANGADVAITSIQGNAISGMYTNAPELVTLFNQSLMHAFVKGKKF